MEETEIPETKSQNNEEDGPKEKVHVELIAPADELIIKREPADVSIEQKEKEADEAAARADQEEKRAEAVEKRHEEQKKEEESGGLGGKEIAGYKLGELAKAPVEPPEEVEGDEPKIYHKAMVITGSIVALIGLIIILPLISWGAAIAVMLIGAAIVTAGVVPKF